MRRRWRLLPDIHTPSLQVPGVQTLRRARDKRRRRPLRRATAPRSRPGSRLVLCLFPYCAFECRAGLIRTRGYLFLNNLRSSTLRYCLDLLYERVQTLVSIAVGFCEGRYQTLLVFSYSRSECGDFRGYEGAQMDHCDFGRSWTPIAHRFLLGRFRYSDVSHRNIDKVLLPNLIKRSFFECDILVLRTRIENEVVQHLDPFCRRQNTELDEKLEKK